MYQQSAVKIETRKQLLTFLKEIFYEQKKAQALKTLANSGLQLDYEHINPHELSSEVNKLPNNENIIIQLSYGFLDNCQDIVECAAKLQISPVQANKILTAALEKLLAHKNNYYHPSMIFSDDYEEAISELGNLNVRSYNALIRAGKKNISDIENMSLGELLTLPGLMEKDYQVILLALEEHRNK